MSTRPTGIRAFFKSRGITLKGLVLWFLAAGVIVAAVSYENRASTNGQIFPVHFSEVLASNASYPNSDGRCCDYIEIYNSADYPVDISEFQMGDIAGKSRYKFLENTVIQPGEYLVVYCSKAVDDAGYAPFEINRAGAEDFYLISKNGAVVDSVTTMAMDIDKAMALREDGTWQLSGATPGRHNDAISDECGDIYNPGVSPVRISEFSSADTAYLYGCGIYCDWVELHNSAAEPVDISGFSLSDNVGNDKYIFPAGTVVDANGYLVVYCSDRVADAGVAPFGLSQETEETLALKNASGMIVELVRSAPMETGAMALGGDGAWALTAEPSPGYENTAQGHRACMQQLGAEKGCVRISELMSAEQLVKPDQFGEFSDWVELYNTTDKEINLSGWCLTDDPTQPQKWMIRELTLRPGQRTVIFCSGREITASGEIHTNFSLSAGGESLMLSSCMGNIVDEVSFPKAKPHYSFVFEDDGQAVETAYPTPGYPNDESGYETFCATAVPTGPLAIWEVMTANDVYLPQVLGKCYDWVELRNVSDSPVDLRGFSISDDADNPGMCALGDGVLQPGQTIVIILSEEENTVLPNYTQAMFALNAGEDKLFLFGPEGELLDYVHLKDIPLGCSYGRSEETGGFCYMEPSPQNPNNAGYRLISSTPVSAYVPGVYSQEGGFSVTLEAQGDIYYTTDGSVPDASSQRYEGSLQLDKTTVLRAVAIEEGKMASEIYTTTFVVGDLHELPVVSLVTDPENLWGVDGIYKNGDLNVKELRVPGHVSYSGEDGSFAINCSINLHGMTTVTAFDKKTFALRFEDCYDGPLHYDVFEDGEVTDFASLLIRTAHESTFSSQMHDAFIGYIASQCSDSVLSQKYKYVSLYLNGEYWGLYAIRERHSQEHYASYMNEPAEGVEIVRYMIDVENSLSDLYHFCEYNSLASDENYAYAKSVVDMESYVDWLIFEAYMANVDVNTNIRFYKSPVNGVWRLGLTDLDLGIVGTSESFDMLAACFHHGLFISSLMENEEFKDLLASRLAELIAGPMSDENMIATINVMADTIRSEAYWEEARWGTPVKNWEKTVKEMIVFCDGRAQEMIDSLCKELKLSQTEREAYFGYLE